jgi:hypothetical protein
VATVRAHLSELANLVGALAIVTEPASARVTIDGREIGPRPSDAASAARAPLVLSAGNHAVEVTAEGYHPERREVLIVARQRQQLAFRLRPRQRTARLEVVVRPADAAIRIDSRTVGRGRVRLELPGGGHALQISLPGYQAQQRELVVVPGQNRVVEVALDPVARPVYRRWWFWTAIGAAVAGGAAAAAILTTRPDSPRGTLTPNVQTLRIGW